MARYVQLTLDSAAALPAPRSTSKTAASKTAAPKRSVFQRLVAALVQARMRQAEAEVARYLATTGSKLTDSVEREIERRLAGDRPSTP